MKKLLIAAVFLLFSGIITAQYNYRDSNRIGIIGGVNQFTLFTDNFDTKPGIGWNAGLSVRGNFYNDFDIVYALHFSENNFTVATKNPNGKNEEVNYKLSSAQISFLFSYKIVENHLSVELGPLFQINGKFDVDDQYKQNTVNSTTLYVEQTLGISNFNFYPVIGITGGVTHFRATVQYQYGLTNMLGGLNNPDEGINDFKGHAGVLSGNLLIYL
jgi:hypothetical protein